jgi:hypothetical protein
LLILEKRTGVKHELLADAPKMPPGAELVWSMFCECRADALKDQRITASTMQSVEWSMGINMQLWERQLIRQLDWLYFKVRDGD